MPKLSEEHELPFTDHERTERTVCSEDSMRGKRLSNASLKRWSALTFAAKVKLA